MPLDDLIDRHRDLLTQARTAIGARTFFSAYPESPSPRVYGETAAGEGTAAYEARLGTEWALPTPGARGQVATERSPFGPELGVRYPRLPADADAVGTLMSAAGAAMPAWRRTGVDGRSAVCLEILARLHERIFELAHAVMHTSGQAFVMAFQAGGAHALDRALEAVAYAYAEQERMPASVEWEKASKRETQRMSKAFHVVPRGVALVVGCNTFPTWNSWPGLFASLATGNAVVVKPHPRAVLPLAITVEVAREVLTERGFDPNLVTLAAEDPADGLAAVLAVRPEVRIVDFTGSSAFGRWLEDNATQAAVFTEKTGLNTVVVDSTDDIDGLTANLAFSLSLYTGQMCTAPQNIYLPRGGIDTDRGRLSFDEFGAALAAAVRDLLADDTRAVEILGGVVSDVVRDRVDATAGRSDLVLASRAIEHPAWPDATVRTPAIVALDAGTAGGSGDAAEYTSECFGPVSFLIGTDSTAESIERLSTTVHQHGAMTASVYSTDPAVLDAVEEAAVDAGVALSVNLTDGVYVNQTSAFSDLHGTGANPAANSCFTDAAFVTPRFRFVATRRHLP
ncbi:phenylacetic acid degradation protein paaN [Haloactinopolyspora alba]|uniref:Phenylacetic acid degradation protein paaN n=1 Tax=Haloactinopolyspora alba TaxID=648780 RepID=A0A2P8EFX1_9ACTN|nr:phenylacetic acid degradation protein PaaN [Haloactinopolyspora alba]PSL08352.1 phenylacetic acid degradation protein paaN [Haloactinopolyspora alba]